MLAWNVQNNNKLLDESLCLKTNEYLMNAYRGCALL